MSYLSFRYNTNIEDIKTLKSNLEDRYWFKHQHEYFECAKRGKLVYFRQKRDKVVDRTIRIHYNLGGLKS